MRLNILVTVGLLALAQGLGAAGVEQQNGSKRLVGTEVWQVMEATSTTWQCHELDGLVGINQTAKPDSRTFGIAVENIEAAGQPGICFAPGATAATIVGRPCPDPGVLFIDAGLLGPVSMENSINNFCWRSVSGTPVASFTANW